MKTKHGLLALGVLIVFALHQDFWNWTKAAPLLFGLLTPSPSRATIQKFFPSVKTAMLLPA